MQGLVVNKIDVKFHAEKGETTMAYNYANTENNNATTQSYAEPNMAQFQTSQNTGYDSYYNYGSYHQENQVYGQYGQQSGGENNAEYNYYNQTSYQSDGNAYSYVEHSSMDQTVWRPETTTTTCNNQQQGPQNTYSSVDNSSYQYNYPSNNEQKEMWGSTWGQSNDNQSYQNYSDQQQQLEYSNSENVHNKPRETPQNTGYAPPDTYNNQNFQRGAGGNNNNNRGSRGFTPRRGGFSNHWRGQGQRGRGAMDQGNHYAGPSSDINRNQASYRDQPVMNQFNRGRGNFRGNTSRGRQTSNSRGNFNTSSHSRGNNMSGNRMRPNMHRPHNDRSSEFRRPMQNSSFEAQNRRGNRSNSRHNNFKSNSNFHSPENSTSSSVGKAPYKRKTTFTSPQSSYSPSPAANKTTNQHLSSQMPTNENSFSQNPTTNKPICPEPVSSEIKNTLTNRGSETAPCDDNLAKNIDVHSKPEPDSQPTDDGEPVTKKSKTDDSFFLEVDVDAKIREYMGVTDCSLCSIHFPNKNCADQHYSGKLHARKVKMFRQYVDLQKYIHKLKEEGSSVSGETLEVPPEEFVPSVEDEKILEDQGKESTNFYCKLCQIPFNSLIHARSHYAGKAHKKKVNKTSVENGTVEVSDDYEPPTAMKCDLCSVHVTSEEQLSAHMNGAKHKAKLRQKDKMDSSKSFGYRRKPGYNQR